MAQQSLFWTTDGTGHGPAGGYSQQRIYDWKRKTEITDQQVTEGVFKSVDNDLFVTGSASPLTLKSGAANVYGFFYENTADLNVAVPTPAATTGGRVVLRADWTQQTVTATGTMSASGVTDPPALNQSAGSVWEVSLFTFTITSGGVVTLTDGRSYAHFGTMIRTEQIDDGAVTDAKIRDSAALSVIGRASNSSGDVADIVAGTAGYPLRRTFANTIDFSQIGSVALQDDAVIEAKILDGAVTSGKLGANAVIAGKIADGAVDVTASLADDIVDDTKVGNRVPQFYRRQGGASADWNTQGITTYTPTTVRMQAGNYEWTGVAGVTGNGTVTFPTAFSNVPLVIIIPQGSNGKLAVSVQIPSATNFTFTWNNVEDTQSFTSTNFIWLAIGPE